MLFVEDDCFMSSVTSTGFIHLHPFAPTPAFPAPLEDVGQHVVTFKHLQDHIPLHGSSPALRTLTTIESGVASAPTSIFGRRGVQSHHLHPMFELPVRKTQTSSVPCVDPCVANAGKFKLHGRVPQIVAAEAFVWGRAPRSCKLNVRGCTRRRMTGM